ncbi:acyl-CoA thioester hydrolase/BAAT C-terminal domain-containing protein [Haloarchaeobius sp. HME9146]|uniref:acyl-CoA thioester hydrolase/BAAT C-terminal domain-containing protein n=1 Tax=Haloarchaeobius sp. HME9146 TaxID=2978732 RepID=UPI0021C0B54C|nr:acyl-CoA thioesterase/bile acid-CoA:amino acid N-acyltransferase family protein [Haloarchaeobius sp. HME9146]MCT9097056.1 acyl-CoA thioesterase/BAAT N-terminal domain-containing protein [Haloarchaeobius sp. HME9146]
MTDNVITDDPGTETDTDDPKTTLTIHAPDTSRNDEPVAIRLAGLDPDEHVTFTASLTADDGVEWYSKLTFQADDDGTVDLTEHAPESGSYDGCEPMGWLWAMDNDADEAYPVLGEDPRVATDLRASTDDAAATRTITRTLYDPGITSRPVDRDDLVGTLFEPPGDGPHPAILDLHGSAGRLSTRRAKLLADKGYATLALDYFGEGDPIPDDHRNVPLEYFDSAREWLREQPGIDAERIGAFGVSRGAELALLLGARRDWVGVVISYAGSGLAWDTPSGEPAWTDGGEPVPHIVAQDTPGETVEKGIDDEEIERVATRVENMNGPVLLLSGGDDPVWQSRYLAEIAIERLDRHEFAHPSEHRTYDGVGHYIGTPYQPLSGVGPAEVANATARAGEDSWPRVLEYLEKGLVSARGTPDV